MKLHRLKNFFFRRCDLGPHPCRRLVILLWKILIEGGSILNILIYTLTVAGVVFLLVYFDALASIIRTDNTLAQCTVIWMCIQYSSLTCMYLFCHIIVLNYETIVYIWQTSIHNRNSYARHSRTIIMGLELCSILFLVFSMSSWYSDIRLAGVYFPFTLLFWAMWIFKLMQFLLGSVFLMIVFPVQSAWMTYTSLRTKELVVQLATWHFYNMVLSIPLTFCLRQSDLKYALLPTSPIYLLFYIYFFSRLLWLICISFQIANVSLFPLTYHPEVDSKRLEEKFEGVVGWTIDSQSEVVVGLQSSSRESLGISETSAIVCGTIGDRFGDVIKPLENNKKKKDAEKPSKLPVEQQQTTKATGTEGDDHPTGATKMGTEGDDHPAGATKMGTEGDDHPAGATKTRIEGDAGGGSVSPKSTDHKRKTSVDRNIKDEEPMNMGIAATRKRDESSDEVKRGGASLLEHEVSIEPYQTDDTEDTVVQEGTTFTPDSTLRQRVTFPPKAADRNGN